MMITGIDHISTDKTKKVDPIQDAKANSPLSVMPNTLSPSDKIQEIRKKANPCTRTTILPGKA
jgi:hypothetical protein